MSEVELGIQPSKAVGFTWTKGKKRFLNNSIFQKTESSCETAAKEKIIAQNSYRQALLYLKN